MYALTKVGEVLKKYNFDWFFKFGGRYSFTEKFNLELMLKNVPTFSFIPAEGTFKELCQSVLYSIPREYYILYLEHLKVWLNNLTETPVEQVLAYLIISIPEYGRVEKLEVCGMGATHGKIMKI